MNLDYQASQRFWDFSVALYSAESVASACVALQDRHGVDVNMLLLCIWRGLCDPKPLGQADMGALIAASDLWMDKIIRPLRVVRRQLKSKMPNQTPVSGQLYAKALELELACERAEQRQLVEKLFIPAAEASLAPGGAVTTRQANVVAQNIALYLASGRIYPALTDRESWYAIFDAVSRDAGGVILDEFERLAAGSSTSDH